MDPDVDAVVNYYKHLFPEFTSHHFAVYKMLWRIEPLQVEQILKQTQISKSTLYGILRDLALCGLINKTNFSPPAYYAQNPIKDYNQNYKKILKKLEEGADELKKILENSTSLSGELFLVKRDGGQQKLLIKNRGLLNDAQQLLEIRKVIDEQIKETDKQKLKTIVAYK